MTMESFHVCLKYKNIYIHTHPYTYARYGSAQKEKGKFAHRTIDNGVKINQKNKMGFSCSVCFKKKKKTIFQGSFRFTQNREGAEFPYSPRPHAGTASPSINIPHQSGAFVTNDEPALTSLPPRAQHYSSLLMLFVLSLDKHIMTYIYRNSITQSSLP